MRELKGLQDAISFDAVHPIMGKEGWVFGPSFPGSTPDRINGASRLYEVYLKSDPAYTGRGDDAGVVGQGPRRDPQQ